MAKREYFNLGFLVKAKVGIDPRQENSNNPEKFSREKTEKRLIREISAALKKVDFYNAESYRATITPADDGET